MITWDNYEEYMIMHADGELQPHEEKALEDFLNDHPLLKNELANYERTRLTPDTTIVYNQKNSLLKTGSNRRTISLSNWRTYAIAAGIAALIVFSMAIFRDNNTINSIPVVAVRDTVIGTPVNKVASKKDDSSQLAGITPEDVHSAALPDTGHHEDAPSVKENIAVSVTHKAPEKTANIKHKNNAEGQKEKEMLNERNTMLALSPLNSRELQKLPVNISIPEKAKTVDIPDYTVAVNNNTPVEEAPEESWVDKLPVSDTKKKEISEVANAISQGYEKLTSFKESISERSVTVKIQKKKLLISF